MIANMWPLFKQGPMAGPAVGEPLTVRCIDVSDEHRSVTIHVSSEADSFFDRMLAPDPRAWVRSKPWQKRVKGASK